MKKDRFFTRLSGLFLLLLVSLFLLVSQLQAEGNGQAGVLSGWRKTKDAFDKFLREPTSIKSREFFASIPEDKKIDGDRARVLDYIFQRPYSRYRIISMEILTGDIYAARSAIRMIKFVEGERQERIGSSLSYLIRVNPAVFLRACHEEREDPYIKEKGFPVSFIHPIMKKKERASYELGKRIEALRSVEDPELRPVRDECIKGINKTIEELGLEVRSCADHEERHWDNPREQIKGVFMDILRIPCPENMKKLLALFSDDAKFNVDNIISLIFPQFVGYYGEEPFGVFAHEVRCGNEYAIEVVFRTCRHVWGYPAECVFIEISHLILIRPTLFVEKLAKYRYDLESVDFTDYIDWLCRYISWADYPEGMDDHVILRRRIDALASLNIPEHKELIDLCTNLIRKRINKLYLK